MYDSGESDSTVFKGSVAVFLNSYHAVEVFKNLRLFTSKIIL